MFYWDQAHALRRWRAIARVQHWQPGAETTEVETRMAITSVCAATDHQRQVADRQYKFNMDGHDSG